MLGRTAAGVAKQLEVGDVDEKHILFCEFF